MLITYIKKYTIFAFLLTCPLWIFAQQAEDDSKPVITGVVLESATNRPVPGASVTIQGIASSITDDNGKFSLKKTEAGAIIQVTSVGYASKEVPVKGRTELTILLHDNTFNSIFIKSNSPFGITDRVRTTGSLSVVEGKDNYKKAAASPESILQDEALGLNTLMRSGAPGSGGNMYLRGFTSINATNQPLIIVDGMPYENRVIAPSLISGNFLTPLTGLDVKDIENITVLKDATSIYGSKAANGVIIINTTKAKELATVIDAHFYVGENFEPNTKYPMMNAKQHKTYINDLLMSQLPNPTTGDINYIQSLPFINMDKPVIQKWGVEGNKDYYRYNQQTDWQDQIFQNSLNQNYYISVKGGDEVAVYSLSLGYLNHQGIIKNTDFSRYNTQFNTQINMTSRFKLNVNMNFSYAERKLIFEGLSPDYNPMYVSLVKSPFTAPYVYDEQGIQTPNFEQADVFGITNPTALVADQTIAQNKSYRFFGNVEGIIQLNQNFNINALMGITFDKLRENVFLPSNGLYHENLPNGYVDNEMQASVSRLMQYYGDMRLNYNRVFDRIHNLTGRIGARYQSNEGEYDWAKAYNSSNDNMRTLGYGNVNLGQLGGELGDWRWMSYYLNGEYGLKNRYFLSLNMALDGSSRFGKEADGIKMFDNIFGIFPSVSAAWLLSSEDFMAGADKIDMLKIRAGYTIAGNDDIGNYASRSLYIPQSFLGYQGLVRSNIANPELKWETNTKINAGIDLALFNERLNMSFDMFQSKTTDLLTWKQGEGYYGISQYAVNDGAMKNTGFEVGLNGRIINTGFKWDLGVNISHYKNEVTELSVDRKITEIAGANVLTQVGSPVGLFYGYKTEGVYASTVDANAAGLSIQYPDGKTSFFGAGDVRFVNINGSDKIIDENDMTVIGDPNPDFIGAINNRFQWNRFTLNTVFTFSYGNDVYNSVRADLESGSNFFNQTEAVVNRWSYEGHITNMPKVTYGDPMSNARFSDRWIEDGSYIRMKNISLSYDIPIKQRFLRGIQVYITGNNLLTFTKYLGYDPEFSANQSPLYYGIDTGLTPQSRSVLFGVKVGL